MQTHDGDLCRPRAKNVLVIGAGVSGLTSALCLARRGYGITVLADRFAPRVTSVVAGALWEWPPAVCGHNYDPVSMSRAKRWCKTSYEIFTDLAADPETGVFLRPVTYYFKQPIDEDAQQLAKMAEVRETVQQFRRDSALVAANGINPQLGLSDAYRHLAPMIDTDVYMRWLSGEVVKCGCRLVERRLTGLLAGQAEELAHTYSVDAIVNCSGLGAGELAADDVYPVRGAIIRLINDGAAMPRITEAHCISRMESDLDQGFVFIVPRGKDRLILGGFAEPNEWNLNIGLETCAAIRKTYERCLEFMPVLERGEIDAAEPVRAGLRPFRRQSVRLELEPDTRIVHNYGHGGSGITYSWGCAFDVSAEIDRLFDSPGRTILKPQAVPC